MKKIGIALMLIGEFLVYGLVGTDDFYTMELHTSHQMDWKGLIISMAILAAGTLLYWIGDNFNIRITRKTNKRRTRINEYHDHI